MWNVSLLSFVLPVVKLKFALCDCWYFQDMFDSLRYTERQPDYQHKLVNVSEVAAVLFAVIDTWISSNWKLSVCCPEFFRLKVLLIHLLLI